MPTKKKLPLPLLALDTIGVLMLSIGMAEYFVNLNIVPEDLRFDNYAMVMMVVGGFLMIPMVVWIFKNLSSRQSKAN